MGATVPETTPAQTLWQHAEKLQPKAPWRAIVREFGINEAVAQDAHRNYKLPPGITGDAVSRFLELPASALAQCSSASRATTSCPKVHGCVPLRDRETR
jgi:hypothetical protein